MAIVNRCMPWPLAVFCLLDNGTHDWHGDGPEAGRLACRAHDRVMLTWRRLMPRSESRFNRKHLEAS
jgi:hypothetical protein